MWDIGHVQLAQSMGISYSAVVLPRFSWPNMSNHRLASYVDNESGGSSRSSSWRERSYKRNGDRRSERDEGHSSSGEWSSQIYRSMFEVSEQEQSDRRDQDLECLCKTVRGLELEVWGKRRRRDRDELPKGSISVRGRCREVS